MAVSEQLKPFLKAQVVDIHDFSVRTPEALVADANVLMFSTYDRYDQQRLLGQQVPANARVDAYLGYERRARAAGSVLWISPFGVLEFLRTVEMTELKILCARLDPAAAEGNFSGFEPKAVRRRAGGDYRDVQERVLTYTQQIEKRFRLLDTPGSFTEKIQGFRAAWLGSVSDPGDALLVANAKANGINNIISDDQDLSTVDGLVLYTANRTVIDTARNIGRLLTERGRRA